MKTGGKLKSIMKYTSLWFFSGHIILYCLQGTVLL